MTKMHVHVHVTEQIRFWTQIKSLWIDCYCWSYVEVYLKLLIPYILRLTTQLWWVPHEAKKDKLKQLVITAAECANAKFILQEMRL